MQLATAGESLEEPPMPIPNASVQHAEIHVLGLIASGGSTARITNFTFAYRRTNTVNVPSKAALDAAFQAAVVVPLAAALNNRFTQKLNTVRWLNDPLDGAA